MQETASLKSAHDPQAMSTATHCPYCAFQCGMRLLGPREQATVTGDATFPVNKGRLCIKGWTAPATLAHLERLLTPLARDASGTLVPVTWDEALMRVVQAFRDTQVRYGRDAVGIFGGGSLTNEKAYLLGKFARVALGTSCIDYNGRFCMSSAAADLLFPLAGESKALNVADWPDTAQICNCNGVSKGKIIGAVKAGHRSLESVCEATRAGTGCGSCKPRIQALLELASDDLVVNDPPYRVPVH